MKWFQVCVFVLVLMVSAFVPAAHAQSNQGRFSGQVIDSSGAAVPNATVTIENTGTQVKRVLQTNDDGTYVAPNIEPGFYSITVEAPNFRKVVRERVQVEVANDIKVDFTLQPGEINQVVEVTDVAPLTETNNAVLSGVLSNKAINELPLQGRDFQNLLPLHPGVQREPGGGFHSLTSNGLRPDDNNFIIDGANDNDVYYGETVMNDAGISGTPASTLPLDAIQEFNTQEQPQADFGQKPGVVVNIGIKSGTNTVHGTAYYFHRNSAFDARNYFNPSPEPFSALLLHQFGASIGGPIIKDKWFYFANYEGVRDKVGNPYLADSPVTESLIGRVGPDIDPTQYSIVDAMAAAGCPAACNPLSLNLTKLFLPNPGLTASADDPAAIDFDFNNTNREDNIVFKSDYHPNERNTISGRYIYANTNEVEEDAVPIRPEWLSQAKPITQVFGVDWTWTPNSSWVNDFRVSFNNFNETIAPVDSNVPASAYGLNTGITSPQLLGFPRINPDRNTFNYMGGNSSWPLATAPSRTINFSDTVSYTNGKHTFRFGGVLSQGSVNYYRATYGRGRIDFDSLTDFLQGNVHSWELLYGDPGRDISLTSWGMFAQDDYRIARNVTLNLGVRWDVTLPMSDANSQLSNFDPSLGIVQVGNGISEPYQANYNNFSPRLGVAWDVFGSGKTVLRSGFGMIYVQPSIRTFMFNGGGLNLNPSGLPKVLPDGTVIPGNGNMNAIQASTGDPSLINWSTTGPIFPATGADQQFCGSTFDTACNVFGVDQHLKTPYVMNWNLNLQQALSPNTVLQVAYVANRGVKLYSTIDLNQIDPAINGADAQEGRPFYANCPTSLGGQGLGGPCYPYIGFLDYLSNKSTSTYNALQVTLTKRYSHGLYLLAGYTYGHAIDTTSGTTNLADVPQNSLDYDAEKASGDYDIRHRITVSATYELPGPKKWQILSGWQLTGILQVQTGEPLNLYDDEYDLTGTGEGYYNAGWDRWNIIGSPKNLKWSPTNTIPFAEPGDAAYSACQSAANTPALQDALDYVGGCYVQNGTVLYPNAFGTFGNMGRNIMRGPDFANMDMSLGKIFNLGEKLKLQFRGEVFNIFNHPNFSSVGTDIGGSSLGLARSTPDVTASNPVIGSGGSRHIQLGLKLIW